jgi:hypothetical protein
VEPEGLLASLQQLTIGHYPEPDDSNPHPQTLFPRIHFEITFLRPRDGYHDWGFHGFPQSLLPSVEPEGPLLCSQEAVTCPYAEPYESNQHPPTRFS